MMLQGLLLTVIGMGTVFLFLMIMIFLMSKLKAVTDLVARFYPEAEDHGQAHDASARMPMVAAAVLIAARRGKANL